VIEIGVYVGVIEIGIYRSDRNRYIELLTAITPSDRKRNI